MREYHGSALVVGGLGGLGTAIVEALASDGCDVVVADRRAEDFEPWAAERPPEVVDRVRFERVEVGKEESVDALRQRLDASGDHIAYLVACQAADAPAPIWELSMKHWRIVMEVNLTGSFLLARAFSKQMVDSGFGRVVLFSSIWAYRPSLNRHAYAASKGGISALTRSLAVDLGPHGVTSNAVCPGIVWHERLRDHADMDNVNSHIAATSVGRAGTPEECGALVHYLASDGAGFVNGQILHLNGGEFMGS